MLDTTRIDGSLTAFPTCQQIQGTGEILENTGVMMMKRSDVKVVEEILFDYPAICLSLARRDWELGAHGGTDEIGPVQGGQSIPEQERVVLRRLQDAEHCELSAIVEQIKGALAEATDEMREVLNRVFFKKEDPLYVSVEKGWPTSTLYYKRYRAIFFMESACMKVYPIVRRWRQREEMRRWEAWRSKMYETQCNCG